MVPTAFPSRTKDLSSHTHFLDEKTGTVAIPTPPEHACGHYCSSNPVAPFRLHQMAHHPGSHALSCGRVPQKARRIRKQEAVTMIH
jgi:hypothetical protein